MELPLGECHKTHWWWVSIGSGNGLVLSGETFHDANFGVATDTGGCGYNNVLNSGIILLTLKQLSGFIAVVVTWNIAVTSSWARWRLELPASSLFT